MKTKSYLWLSVCLCLAGSVFNASAADEPAAGSSISQTKKSAGDAGKKSVGATAPANAVEAEVVRTVQPVVSVQKTKIAEAKPKSLRHKKYGGPIYAVFTSKDSYQLINPFAPKRYGNAEDNMPKDPSTGKPAGVALLAVHIGDGE